MSIQKEVYIRTCCKCKLNFESEDRRSYVCPDCKRENKCISIAQRNNNFKKPRVIAHYRPAADVGIIKFVRIIDRYNAEHGTHYNYGKFMQLVASKKINFNEATKNA